MSHLIFISQVPLARVTKASPGYKTSEQPPVNESPTPEIWAVTAGGMALLTIALIIYGRLRINRLKKRIRFEQFRTKELEKKFKLALETIRKMETNPDLINSRDFNLDYLRMRMAEEVFHYAIVNQIKIKVKDKITQALRPNNAQQGIIGIPNSGGRQIDEIFDVEYETVTTGQTTKRVLFRIEIRLMKLPTQTTSTTINQIIDCVETYLSPAEDHDTWQPTIQGRIAHMQWDQKAKPTPLLVLEQSNEGVNVTFRTNRQPNNTIQSQTQKK